MIHGVFGKLGSGKGLFVMQWIAEELMNGFRDVVTNVPVRVVPWVNGQGVPQIGLLAYLMEKLKASEEVCESYCKRVLVITDMDQMWDMFLNRRDGNTGEWFKLASNHNDEKGRPDRFDPAEVMLRNCAPILCVSDEAWAFYPNNGGWSRSPLIPFYGRQQRKLRDEWLIVTQHPTDVDSVIWNIAQDFRVCRNHGMERLGIFRQPEFFRVITYLTNPAKGNAVRSHEVALRLDKRLCQCYDTTAGVGFAGGLAGDANQKKKGLHIAWAGVGVLLLVAALCAVPLAFERGARSIVGTQNVHPKTLSQFAGVPESVKAPAAALPASSVPAVKLASDVVGEAAAPGSVVVTNEPLFCRGYFVYKGDVTVYLSDGSSLDSASGRITQVERGFVTVDGVRLPVRRSKSVAVASDVLGRASEKPLIYAPLPPESLTLSDGELIHALAALAVPNGQDLGMVVAPTIGRKAAPARISGVR